MNRRFIVVVLLFGISIGACGTKQENEPVGTWVGQTADTGAGAGSFYETWTFQDGKIIVDDGSHAKYVYQVDVTKEPKQIDIRMNVESASEREGQIGIYKIEKDTLTICSLNRSKAKADAKRPEEFDARKRDDVVVLTFRKRK